MTEKKTALVKNESIGRIAYEMGLHKWMIVSKSTEEKQTRTNLKKSSSFISVWVSFCFSFFKGGLTVPSSESESSAIVILQYKYIYILFIVCHNLIMLEHRCKVTEKKLPQVKHIFRKTIQEY